MTPLVAGQEPRLLRVITRGDLPYTVAPIEVRDFRGPDEHEPLLTAYGALTGEVVRKALAVGA